MKWISIDIGIKHFAIVIEEDSNIVYMETINLGEYLLDIACEEKFQPVYAMNHILESINYLWYNCDYILIEQQGVFGNKHKEYNFQTMKLQYQCIQYFLYLKMKHKYTYQLECVPSRLKTSIFKMDMDNTKYNRKKWSVQCCIEILQERNQHEWIEKIKKMKKKDDVCDAFLQLQAFKLNQLKEVKLR